MSNKSVSDFVAAAMDATLNSAEHKALFGTQYKFASDENAAKDKCGKCSKDKDSCMCDSAMADDNDARKHKETSSDSSGDSSHADDNDAKSKVCKECGKPKNFCKCDSASVNDGSGESGESVKAEAAFTVAIDSLLTASAALDSIGMDKSATFSLKLASLVVEAKKKKDSDSKMSDKEKAKEKATKEKAKKDAQDAKDKAAKEKAKEKAKKEKDTQMAKDKAAKEKEKAAKEKARSSSSSSKK
jgi:hypothetical protein